MPQTLDVFSLLSEMELTKGLDETTRKELADQCSYGEMPAKKRVRRTDASGTHLFLLDGHLARLVNGVGERLQSYQGLSEPLEIFEGATGLDDCFVTQTPCLILKIPGTALEAALNSTVEVSDIELDSTEGEFLAEIYSLISENRLELPARPEVALKIQELTNDPDSGINELTEVIQSDGTIAGALVHATNSPLFRATKQIQSVRDAVLRLGFRNTRMLTTNLALRQAFKARHEVTKNAMQAVWTDGVLRSAFSYLLSDTLKVLHRERALLAGLVAGIGAVPIIQFIEMRQAHPNQDLIDSLVQKLSGITGVLVINYWGLGDDLVTVAEKSNDWFYQASEPDYASLALVAHWAAMQSEGREVPDAATIPAFRLLGLEPPEKGEPISILANSNDELEALKRMFDG